MNILLHFSKLFCVEQYGNQKNEALRSNSLPLGRASPNTIFYVWKKFFDVEM
jgi:hypothetical protein